jgi:hypothetical protein
MKLLTWPNICFLLLASFGVIIFTNSNPNMDAPTTNCKQGQSIAETVTGSINSSIEPEAVHAALDSAKTELALLKNKYSNRK